MKKRALIVIALAVAAIVIAGVCYLFLGKKQAMGTPLEQIHKNFPGSMLMTGFDQDGISLYSLLPLATVSEVDRTYSFVDSGLILQVKKLGSDAYSLSVNDCGVEYAPLEFDCGAISQDTTLLRGKNWYIRVLR